MGVDFDGILMKLENMFRILKEYILQFYEYQVRNFNRVTFFNSLKIDMIHVLSCKFFLILNVLAIISSNGILYI